MKPDPLNPHFLIDSYGKRYHRDFNGTIRKVR